MKLTTLVNTPKTWDVDIGKVANAIRVDALCKQWGVQGKLVASPECVESETPAMAPANNSRMHRHSEQRQPGLDKQLSK